MNDRLGTLLGKGKAALILCEVQEGVLGASAPWPQLRDIAAKVDLIGNVTRLAAGARRLGVPVIHCTAQFLPERFGANSNARLFGAAKKQVENDQSVFARPIDGTYEPGDILLPRLHGLSPLTGSSLDSILRNEAIDTLIVTGVSISFAVTNLVMDAVNRSYRVILPRDAAAGFPEEYAQQVIDNSLAMLASICTTQDVVAAWESTTAP